MKTGILTIIILFACIAIAPAAGMSHTNAPWLSIVDGSDNSVVLTIYNTKHGQTNLIWSRPSLDSPANWTLLTNIIANSHSASISVSKAEGSNLMFQSSIPYPNTVYPAPDYLSWTFGNQIVLSDGLTAQGFGGPQIWDSVSNVWRTYTGYAPGKAGSHIRMAISTDGVNFGRSIKVFDIGPPGTWDSGQIAVPFVWLEDNQARSWRMLYRGSDNGVRSYIGLATSTNGVDWERIDTLGNILTSYVVSNAISSVYDFGNVFWASNKYWLYYDTIDSNRRLFLATSTNLVNWNHPVGTGPIMLGSTNANGGWDYDDRYHKSYGHAPTNGVYCPWVGRWDRPDGTPEWRMYVIMNIPQGSIGCYTSETPDFTTNSRTFRGLVWDATIPKQMERVNYAISSVDVPRIYCDDITQNPVTSTRLGSNNILMWKSDFCAVAGWLESFLWKKWEAGVDGMQTNGMTLDAMACVFPVTNANLHLAFGRDTSIITQIKPALKGTIKDLGYGNYVYTRVGTNSVLLTDTNGAYFDNSYLLFAPNTNINWVVCTNDFTLEFTASKASMVGAGNLRSPFAFSGGAGKRILDCHLLGSANDSAVSWRVQITDQSDITRSWTSSPWDWADNARHSFAFCRSNGVMFWYKDGTLQGTGSLNYPIKVQSLPIPIQIGTDSTLTNRWHGYIDEFRFFSKNLYTVNYVVTPLPITYKTNGFAFTRVYDFGREVTPKLNAAVSVPQGCTLAISVRGAAHAWDKSTIPADFGTSTNAQYVQWCIQMTGDGVSTPEIFSIAPSGED